MPPPCDAPCPAECPGLCSAWFAFGGACPAGRSCCSPWSGAIRLERARPALARALDGRTGGEAAPCAAQAGADAPMAALGGPAGPRLRPLSDAAPVFRFDAPLADRRRA